VLPNHVVALSGLAVGPCKVRLVRLAVKQSKFFAVASCS